MERLGTHVGDTSQSAAADYRPRKDRIFISAMLGGGDKEDPVLLGWLGI